MNNQMENRFSVVNGQTDLGLLLSADAKPRLKWTPELHRCFVNAVSQLGGEDEATPKAVMRVMDVPGLTLYHLKSHLQKFRLGMNKKSETCSSSNNKEDCSVANYSNHGNRRINSSDEEIARTCTQVNVGFHFAKALQMQMEAQKKLNEQIEVQRHLQLRIEAQGKYLQSVLKKAQETLAGYNSSMGVEAARAQLLELATMVDTECPSSCLSELTDSSDLRLIGGSVVPFQPQPTDSSMDSCLTSSVTSERKDGKAHNLQSISACYGSGDTGERNRTSMITWVEVDLNKRSCRQVVRDEKRNWWGVDTGVRCIEKRQLKKVRVTEELDLNRQYQSEMDSGRQELDLNSWN